MKLLILFLFASVTAVISFSEQKKVEESKSLKTIPLVELDPVDLIQGEIIEDQLRDKRHHRRGESNI